MQQKAEVLLWSQVAPVAGPLGGKGKVLLSQRSDHRGKQEANQ